LEFFSSGNSTIFADFLGKKSSYFRHKKILIKKKQLVCTLILQCAQNPKPKPSLEGRMPSTTLSFYFILFKSYLGGNI
jgi:hypothetical protein